jgi:CDP-glucose 4,6-dehydratase
MFDGFYSGKRVLVTGHTGFKGSWLSLWLKRLGAEVWGLGLPAPTRPNFSELIHARTFAGESACDVRDRQQVAAAMAKVAPDLVFHLAAQPLVRRSYAHPVETFETNTLGTIHLLEAVRQAELPCAVVVITTDKCYENHDGERDYRENDPLGGHDVYSMSKAAAELVVQSWRRSFFLPNPKLGNIATGRAGNVIGGGDYAEDRLVPDCVRALLDNRPIPVRNPSSTRPWQHVLDCLSGYLWLGACLARADKSSPLAGPFNFGPGAQANLPVSELVQEILRLWPGQWKQAAPGHDPAESTRLNLAIDKAAALLRWFPAWDFREAIQQTVAWYHQRHVKKNPDMLDFSAAQIDAFTRSARARELVWAATSPP